MLAPLFTDLRLAARSLFARPGFTLVAVVTLALGVGANTAIFSVVNRMILDPLPFEDEERLAFPWRSSHDGRMAVTPSPAQLATWRARARTIEGLAPFGIEHVALDENGVTSELSAGTMTDDLLRLLGVRPALGRAFVEQELKPGGPPVAMLGYGLWKTRFGGERDVIGQAVTVDGESRVVVGVMPHAMDLALGSFGDLDIWLPLVVDPKTFGVNTVVKRRAGVGHAAMQAELARLGAETEEPSSFFTNWRIVVKPAGEELGSPRRPLLVMMGAVCLVLLVACANVANLVMVRAEGRRHELAIRAALGAGRARLFQQLFTESILLALMGGAAGLLAAMWGVDAIVALRPDTLTELETVRFDPTVLRFGMGVAALSGILFGLAPAFRAASPHLNEAIKTGGAGFSPGRRRARAVLVTAEVALSVVLLVGAGLLARSFARLQQVDPGYEVEGLISARLELPEGRYPDSTARRVVLDQLAQRVAAIPGVAAAIVGGTMPPRGGVMFGEPELDGRRLTTEEKAASRFSPIGAAPEVFRVLGVRVVEGRPFAAGQRGEVVVSQSVARRYWPEQSALGKRLRIGRGDWWTVVGVAAEILPFGRRGHNNPMQVYFSRTGSEDPRATLMVRARGDPLALIPSLRAAMASIDRSVPLLEVATVRAQLARGIARERFSTALLVTFAALALLLSAVGLYGVLSYAVAQRTREIGIRIALGARTAGILGLVVGQAMRLSALGAVAGVVGALALGRVLSSMLYEVEPRDPVTIAGVVLLVMTTSLVAAVAPARRASRVDPAEAIRTE